MTAMPNDSAKPATIPATLRLVTGQIALRELAVVSIAKLMVPDPFCGARPCEVELRIARTKDSIGPVALVEIIEPTGERHAYRLDLVDVAIDVVKASYGAADDQVETETIEPIGPTVRTPGSGSARYIAN